MHAWESSAEGGDGGEGREVPLVGSSVCFSERGNFDGLFGATDGWVSCHFGSLL